MALHGPHVLFVSHFEPTPAGHGGNHRTYQIAQQLREAFGHEAVTYVNARAESQSTGSVSPAERARSLAGRTQRAIGRVARGGSAFSYSPRRFASPDLME